MQTKKLKTLSIISLIISVFPLATLIPVFLKATLPQGVNMMWACFNIISVLLGLPLSVICIARKESRSAVNIISTVISAFLTLVMLGIVVCTVLYSIP